MRKQPKKTTEKKFIHMNGKKGQCLICNSEQRDVVNGICYSCITKDNGNGKRN